MAASYPAAIRSGWFARLVIGFLLSQAIFFTSYPAQPAQAAVDLLYFRVSLSQGKVMAEWETAAEIATAGFFVARSSAIGGPYTRLNSSMIFARGDSLVGDSYTYLDENPDLNARSWYRLEVVDTSSLTTYSDPQAIIPNQDTQTPTATQTATVTASATASSTPSSTATAAPTATPTPTSTNGVAYPLPTNTPPPTAIIFTLTPTPPGVAPQTDPAYPAPQTATQAPDAISTIGNPPTFSVFDTPGTSVPLPEITIQFPALTTAPVMAASAPQPVLLDETTPPARTNVYPLLLIGAAWMILAGLFYFFQNRLH